MPAVYFVTGSSRGLGREIVIAALEAGHQVVGTARRPGDLDDLLARHGDLLLPVALDVADPQAARDAVATALEAFQRIDVVVNNAGYADIAAVEDVTDDDFRAQIETNLFWVVNVTKAALPVMREQGSGHLITVSSVGGRLATPGLSAYQAAKWGLGGFCSVLAAEGAPLGIHVTVLEPGGMRTDWAGSSMQVGPISAAYQQTVGGTARMHDDPSIVAGSDPTKVAKVVLDVAAMADPPLRLLLGSDAWKYATAAGRALLESDEQRQDLSFSTDRDDHDSGHDPMALLTS